MIGFFLVGAMLLLIVLAVVALPLLRGARAGPTRGEFDRAVYRDQLTEVDRDLARGVIDPDQAGSARLEIQRRLLAVDTSSSSPPGLGRNPFLGGAAMAFVVLIGGALYMRLGAPGLPDAPYADRPKTEADTPGDDQHLDMRKAAELLRQKLQTDPSNARGWMLYARTESILGEWNNAADAYRHAIDLGLKDAATYAGYGEMLVMGADGVVPPAAHDAFTAALAADQSNAVARYYLALADAQSGEERRAIGAWLELAAGLPDDSPMRDEIARRIADAAKSAGIDAPPLPKGLTAETPAGPTAEQMAAAAALPPEQRAQMINGMIEQLAAKLKQQPNDLDGWLRLARAYMVRGETAKAVDAYDHAAALRPNDPEIKLQTVAAMLSGLKPGEPVPARATAMLNEVAAVAPDAPEVLWFLGLAAARAGDTETARTKWTLLLRSVPDGDDAKMVKAALDQLPAK